MNSIPTLNTEFLENAGVNLIKSGVILTVGFLIQVMASVAIRVLTKKIVGDDEEPSSDVELRIKTLAGILNNISSFAIFSMVLLMLLSQWGIDITPLLTGAGILGLAVGFGTQTLVRDVVTGFFILMENQYKVGDKIKIAGVEGTVRQVKLRTTEIIEDNGTVHTVPHSQIAAITRFENARKR